MPEITISLPLESIEMTDEMLEMEAMYAEMVDLWSN